MPLFDRKKLMEDADGFTVASYIGMDMQTKGSKTWIYCPGHEKRLGKRDSRMSNCHLTKYGYICYACGTSVNVFDMVKEFYESEYGQTISDYEAMGIVADALGGKALYYADVKYNGKYNQQTQFILSSSDYELIDLNQNLYYEKYVNCGYDPEEATENGLSYKKSDDFEKSGLYIYYKKEHISLSKIANENYEAYQRIIIHYAKKAKEKHEKAIEQFCNINAEKAEFFTCFSKEKIIDNELVYRVKQNLMNRLNRINDILIELGVEFEEKKQPKDYFALFG